MGYLDIARKKAAEIAANRQETAQLSAEAVELPFDAPAKPQEAVVYSIEAMRWRKEGRCVHCGGTPIHLSLDEPVFDLFCAASQPVGRTRLIEDDERCNEADCTSVGTHVTGDGRFLCLLHFEEPDRPCPTCKRTAWWWRPANDYGKGGWVCGSCHPRPEPLIEKGE